MSPHLNLAQASIPAADWTGHGAIEPTASAGEGQALTAAATIPLTRHQLALERKCAQMRRRLAAAEHREHVSRVRQAASLARWEPKRLDSMCEPESFWASFRVLGLASAICQQCAGTGLIRPGRVCGCVLRAVFRACLARYRECREMQGRCSRGSLTREPSGRIGRHIYGRKREEFLADFELIARRSLSLAEWRLLRLAFLQGGCWRASCGALGLSRGNFFHAIYRLEAKLGRVFATLRPYPLFPLDEYFGGVVRKRELLA